ncbi:hypothetical protein [Streptomyces sp. NPDC006510]|uniref:hypothetical protein n=1 Tax=Streptomyces sp. NPDC006510 TaxID=3155600 RepID=UPI0033ADCA68
MAPKFTTREPLSRVRDAEGRTALRIAQAGGDRMVHHYDVDIIDATTGAPVVTSEVLSDLYFMPRPNSLGIPVPGAVRGGRYVARVVAVDAYGNASPAASPAFRE